LHEQIKHAGFKVTSLHSDRTQGQRQTALAGFQRGQYQIMVATDIAARGLDVEGISHVINFDMPDTADAYIHRIGRTGRAGRSGDAFTLVTREDETMIRTLEKMTAQKLDRQTLEGFDYSTPGPVRPHSVQTPGSIRLSVPFSRQTSLSRLRRQNAKAGNGYKKRS
jgi:ATP-dependent RNA helicase RhlE